MGMGLPSIEVVFKQLADTAVARSERGVLAVVIQDGTKDVARGSYTSRREVAEADYTADNFADLCRAFLEEPYRLEVVRVPENGTWADAEPVLARTAYNWLCAVPQAFQTHVADHVKRVNAAGGARRVKALVAGVAAADDMHVVNVPNTAVTPRKAAQPLPICRYLPRLGAVLAACPMTESVTGRALEDLEAAEPVEDPGASVDAGNLALYLDEDTVRISRGVNTLTTVRGAEATEDMKKITVVEGLDLLREDIIRTFQSKYSGRYKNNADNQALFVSAVQSYFRRLEREDVLDNGYPNAVAVDTEAMRAAWAADGTDVTEWTEAQTRKRTYKSRLFLSGDVRVLDAMEDLKFVIGLA